MAPPTRLVFSTVSALLVGVAFLAMGFGLQNTLLAVRADAEGFSEQVTGLVMATYFAGFVAGTLTVPRLIERTGHIRVFAALASLASIATLSHALKIDPWTWAVLRALTGWCYAGLAMVAESWLNGSAVHETRGRILSVYGIVMLGAWVVAQALLTTADPDGFRLFLLVSILISLSLVPVTLSRVQAPVLPRALKLKMGRLYGASPLGVIGCVAAGLAMNAFWSMGPVYARSIGLDAGGVALFMGVTMAGALAFQWPVGVLSDRFDRRWVILGTCLVTGVTALVLAMMPVGADTARLGAGFLFGGLGSSLYSLCVAHTNDYLEPEELVTAASGLLLMFGFGSMIGPAVAGALMGRLDPSALFVWSALVMGGAAAFALWRMTRRAPIPSERREAYRDVPRTTPVAMELDPRARPAADGGGAPPLGTVSADRGGRRTADPQDTPDA
jgi:MFS family permease